MLVCGAIYSAPAIPENGKGGGFRAGFDLFMAEPDLVGYRFVFIGDGIELVRASFGGVSGILKPTTAISSLECFESALSMLKS